jgi:hydrogenase/urease accessory protein HupE
MSWRALSRAVVFLMLVLGALPAIAHEVRPAYLDLREVGNGQFDVLWKTPMAGNLRLALEPEFSGEFVNVTPVVTRRVRDAAVQTWRVEARTPLRGQTLTIRGLETTLTDTLVRIDFADGSQWVKRLTAQAPATTIPVSPTTTAVAAEYLKLGVLHILLGVDHLLFVLALLLLARNFTELVKTITAFTVAHSITLALAALGFVHVPQAPVEAAIALSILFVAAEILRARRGHVGLAFRAPWLVAFAVGLLHGFGFAGALAEVGLPEGHIPFALLFFNVGVELGQLAFIVTVLAGLAAVRRLRFTVLRWSALWTPYAIGSLAMAWLIQRVAAF